MMNLMDWIKPQIAFCGDGGGGGGGGASDGPSGKSSNSDNAGLGAPVGVTASDGPSGKSSNSDNAGLGAPVGGGLFGYDSPGDMIDGGGKGKSGDTFGGALGGISNALGATPYGSGIEATGIAGAASSPVGRAALGALTGGLPGALAGYSAASRADANRDGRDPDKGILGISFGTSGGRSTTASVGEGVGEGGDQGLAPGINPEAVTSVGEGGIDNNPCPEGYIFDDTTMSCIIDPDLDLMPETPTYQMNPVVAPPTNYTQPTSGFIPTPLQPNQMNPMQMQLNQLNQAIRGQSTPAQPQMRGLSGINTNRTGIMGAP